MNEETAPARARKSDRQAARNRRDQSRPAARQITERKALASPNGRRAKTRAVAGASEASLP
ncbi:hypothetical protein [Rhodobium gokarnense]|uniref:Uncharacterized protein n=1 Tax=Rhodobium gokarnense TaxID=364296 RepID=A0ABT3H6S8_9HYPH|nr:hypothetical protein [Rhodobium gokarnense]MCW2306090.1 hypothetical protein [Rhodobium gokarnense]